MAEFLKAQSIYYSLTDNERNDSDIILVDLNLSNEIDQEALDKAYVIKQNQLDYVKQQMEN
jgi:hypothetical protein